MRSMWHGITLPEVSCRVHPANRIVSQILLMIVGYARTSSLAQVAGLEAQERNLRSAGATRFSVSRCHRWPSVSSLSRCSITFARVTSSPLPSWTGRLARSVGDLLAIVAQLEAKKVSLRVLSISGNQPLDTSTSTGRLMLSVIGAVGQAEREAMLERQREGIARAKAQNRYKGRVPTARRQTAEIIRLKAEGDPRKSPASWGSAGPASIGSWANRTPERAKKLPDREFAGPRIEIIALRLTRCLGHAVRVAMTFGCYD